jgi:hypothetical protein
MTYSDYLSTSELTRWNVDTDIDWNNVQPDRSGQQPELLERIRASALIESFFPIFTPRALELLWANPKATALFSVQLYESYRHFHTLNLYLEAVGYRPITDEEIIAVRRRHQNLRFTDVARLLTRYLMSEHFAAHYFFKDARQAADPVLGQILQLIAKDEVRHCQFAFDLLGDHLRDQPADAETVLDEARHFRHIGELVVDEMPVAKRNDFAAIVAIQRKLERLTGKKISARIEEVLEPVSVPVISASVMEANSR